MAKFVDRTDQRFGRLVVLSRYGTNALGKVTWECLCDCGAVTVVPSGSLVTGNTTSCGCLFIDTVTKHGGCKKASYNTWRAMMRRCYNPKDKDFKRYGRLGVLVCQEWHSYSNFAMVMGEPDGDETLDRIDPYGNYSPENCRWAGVKTQNRNTKVRTNSRTGYTGVSVVGKKFMAKVQANKKAYYSKVCASLEEAVAARKELERLHWGT
jgi:hypothetical protein